MRIIVVGGGIGGLATAAMLHRAGVEPIVLEQAAELLQIGAGINISANGMKALRHLGADQHVRDTCAPSQGAEFADLVTGEVFSTLPLGERGEAAWGEAFYPVHRADLLDALLGVVPDSSLRLGSRVSDIAQRGDQIVVELSSGETVVGDAVVGADGLRSTVRSSLFGEQPAQPTGYVAWRSLIEADGSHGIDARPFGRTWVGQRRHVVFYPVSGGRLLNFVGFVPNDEVVLRESWTASGDVAELQASFANACAEVREIVDAIDEAFVTGIYFRDPLSTWGKGRATLLGDAAHPMPPSAAQGACMALEDAVMFGLAVERFGKLGIERALREYESRRIPRTSRVFGTAMNNFKMFNESDPVLLRGRSGRYRGLARLDPLSESTWGWIYRYHVVSAIGDAPPTVADGADNPLRRPAARKAFEQWRGALRATDLAAGEVGLRTGYDRFLLEVSAPDPEAVVEEVDCDGVPALAVMPKGTRTGPVVLHVHGGLFTMGSARSSVGYAARLAHAIDGWSLVVDYRLAPEHEHPKPIDDVEAAQEWLRNEVAEQAPLILSGSDAGAALTIAATIRTRDRGGRIADGLFLVSPLTDLRLQSDTLDLNQSSDPFISRAFLTIQVASHIHGCDPASPAVSPALADLEGLPPLAIIAAAQETLAADAVSLAERARTAGVDVQLMVAEDSVHQFVLFDDLPETTGALQQLRDLATKVAPRA